MLSEEQLAKILSHETTKVNLEHSYHISNRFIGKISTVAPNIENLSLRRMPNITNETFGNLFTHFERLVSVDLYGCTGLKPNPLHMMLTKNKNLTNLQLSCCSQAVDIVTYLQNNVKLT